jgi:thioester reductase-like protein
VVLITGTTGHIASEILLQLLYDPSVTRIYTYNRPHKDSGILARHRNRFLDKGLDTKHLNDPKLLFLEGHMYEENLGLEEVVYETVSHGFGFKLEVDVSGF